MDRFARIFWVDLRALALLRIALGAFVLCDVCLRARDLGAFYTSGGVIPAEFLIRSHAVSQYLDLYRHCDTELSASLLFLIQGLLAIFLMVGYRTRLVSILSFYLLASLHRRNILVLDAGDLELKVVLFWSIFLPLGARWSIDARRSPKPFQGTVMANVASAAYILQMGFIYLFSVSLKTDPVWRTTGDGLYYSLCIDQHATALGHWLTNYPSALRPFSFLAMALEFSVIFLLCSPWRNAHCRLLTIVALAVYHLVIASLLHFGLFQPICVGMLLGLLPMWLFDKEEPKRSEAGNLPRPLQYAIAAVLFLVFFQNLALPYRLKMHKQAVDVLRRLALLQHWDTFAPHPLVQDGWFIVEATRADGAVVDLLRKGQPLSWDKPDSVANLFPNERWRRYFQTIRARIIPLYQSRFLWWEREQWNRYHTGTDRVVFLRLIYVEEFTDPPSGVGTSTPLRKICMRTYPSSDYSETLVAPETLMQE